MLFIQVLDFVFLDLVKYSFVKNELIVSHAMDSNYFIYESILSSSNFDFHVVNFDDARLHISIELNKCLILVCMVQLKCLTILTGCNYVEALLSDVSILYHIDILLV